MNEPAHCLVPEDLTRIVMLQARELCNDCRPLIEWLQQDAVILVSNTSPQLAEALLQKVAEHLGLLDRLELQAAAARFLGHRQRVGRYGMTVNERDAYQFITPHSEGDSFLNMQLASFYCLRNDTDGGETLLMNVDYSGAVWKDLREKVTRIAPGSRALSAGEIKRLSGLHHLHLPPEWVRSEPVLRQIRTDIETVTLAEVLATVRVTRSRILERDVHAYWSSIANFDYDLQAFYLSLLRECQLLKQPGDGALQVAQLDNVASERRWSSGADYRKLFKRRITLKLRPGDFLLQNNLTWTHAVSNWTPGSGLRQVVAAFA